MKLKSKQLIIETTNLCPYHCEICPRELYNLKKQCMDMNLFRKIIDESIDLGVESYDFCGYGEPLTDKYLEERFRYIRNLNPESHIYISTTAFLMDEEKRKLINEYVTEMKISIYGVSKEVYEKFHGKKDSFERTMNNIQSFMNMKDRKTYVIGNYTYTSVNRDETNAWIKKWEPLLDEITVWKPHNWCGLKNYRKLEGKRTSCGRPINGSPYIHVDGTVSPCCFDILGNINLGNLNDKTISDIFHSKEYNTVLSKHLKHDFSNLLCDTCDQTIHDDSVLVYSNKNRKVGELTSNKMILDSV